MWTDLAKMKPAPRAGCVIGMELLGIDAHNPKYLEPTLIHFMKTRGKNKVIYGTDCPAILHSESIACIRNDLGLSEKVAEKFFTATPLNSTASRTRPHEQRYRRHRRRPHAFGQLRRGLQGRSGL